ncbi:MAG TPA: ADOP family duplicated permease, partial [Candidatus Sulfopaludibacter sp.]|nr:ADOP family duplicated permease [Candidatus Sulfopaludibacter sp.]
EYQRHARSFESVSAATWAARNPIMTGRGRPQHVLAIPATASLFDTLGVKAVLGRTFTAGDTHRGCSVVLAHSFWVGKLGADPKIVGRSLGLDQESCTVLGVMPRGFAFYPPATNLWLLHDAKPAVAGIFARLKQGVTLQRAQAEVESIYRGVHVSDEWRDFVPAVYDLRSEFTFLAGRNLRTTLWILLGAVTLVLLIACGNVANLLLGRALVRGREFAIRAALGGGRGRLFRQLITEGMLLGALGGVPGITVAAGGIRYFRSVNPVELPVGADVTISIPVLAFGVLAAAATAVLFSLAPAWRGSRVALGGRGLAGSRHRLAKLLLAGEMALSVVLLAGAGLLMESVLRLGSAPMGFDTDRLYSTSLAVPKDPHFYAELERRVAAIPGVQSAALAAGLPPFEGSTRVLEVLGATPTERHDTVDQSVSSAYFRTMDVALRSGRVFDSRDDSGAEPVSIVNETLAREYFPNADPLGHRVRLDQKAPWATIVGVVASEKQAIVFQEMNWIDRPILFRPLAQAPVARLEIAIRTASDAIPLGAALRREVAALDPNMVVDDLESMRHRLSQWMAYPRFRAALLSGFAAFALLLSAIGLHGVLSQLVAQRTQEIGVRMALGARPADVTALVARQGGVPVVAGLALGLALAVSLARYLSSVLYQVRPRDPLTLLGVSVVLLVVGALAIAAPARRAARTDPMEALRQE